MKNTKQLFGTIDRFLGAWLNVGRLWTVLFFLSWPLIFIAYMIGITFFGLPG